MKQNHPHRQPGANGAGRPKRRPGERARRLLEMLAQGQDVGEAARRMKRPRPQLEQQLASLLGRLGVTSISAALQALSSSQVAAAAAEEVLPADAGDVADEAADEVAGDAAAEAAAETAAEPAA